MQGVCALQISMANDIWVNWASIEQRLQMMQLTLMRGLLLDQINVQFESIIKKKANDDH